MLCLARTALASTGPQSAGIYRLPFENGVTVKVFDDFSTRRPMVVSIFMPLAQPRRAR